MTTDDIDRLNRKLTAYLQSAARRRPTARRSGPFLAAFDGDDNPYLNYAIPDADADPAPEDVAVLIALFERQGRKPRLEYIPAAAPKVEAALLAAGFTVEARPPVMLCATAPQLPQTSNVEVFLATDASDLAAVERAQSAAFGSPSRGPESLRRMRGAGALVVAARDTVRGTVIGGGVAMPPIGGVSEIAGIGVVAADRRRGAAGAITALLAREALARGVALLWLTPGGPEAERIYARAGFAAVTAALHISRPPR